MPVFPFGSPPRFIAFIGVALFTRYMALIGRITCMMTICSILANAIMGRHATHPSVLSFWHSAACCRHQAEATQDTMHKLFVNNIAHCGDQNMCPYSDTFSGYIGLWQWWEELAVSGWVATGFGVGQGSQPLLGGLTLSSYPDGTGDAWALALSRCAPSYTN